MHDEKNTQLTLIPAFSAFCDSTFPMVMLVRKTLDDIALTIQPLLKGRDYTVCTAEKNFITEVLFADWVQNVFIPSRKNQAPG
jgi:hypothetical protein